MAADNIKYKDRLFTFLFGSEENGFKSSIDQAINTMPDDFLIKPFLEAHRAEVKGMLLEEYNETKTMELFKEEGREEGKLRSILDILNSGAITLKQAAGFTEMSVEDFQKKSSSLEFIA